MSKRYEFGLPFRGYQRSWKMIWKSVAFGSIFLSLFWLFYLHFINERPLASSIFPSILYGLSVATVSVLIQEMIAVRGRKNIDGGR